MTSEQTSSERSYSQKRVTEAIGWLSAEMAQRADAWNGNAPDWFPQPPEWLDLWDQALVATRGTAEAVESAYQAAIEAGERAHLLTIGSPARGLCLRAALGSLSRRGRWHGWLPDVFLIWRGRRI